MYWLRDKVRIALDYQTFCQQPYGGVSRYFVRLAEHLLASEQQVRVFAPLHRNHYVKSLPFGVVQGSALKRYPPKSGRVMLPLNHFFSRRAIAKWQPQVVHETYYSRWRSAPPSCPTVVTVHDMIHELFRTHFPARDNTTRLMRLAVERADHVICVSESTRRDLMRIFGTDEKKVSVVHLAGDHLGSHETKAGLGSHETKAGKAWKTPYLLFVGSREGYKNFPRFLRAVASSPRLKRDFVILAFGGGQFSKMEIQLLSTLGFQPDQVRQRDGDDRALGQIYEGAAALVYPSLYEGFGLPPLEAMAHHCAVVSSNSSSMPEVIGEAGEFFDPRSIDGMAAAIERVVYSSARTRELIELGQKRLDCFSWQRCADRTLDIYRSLAA
jgi:glycosyltransferase involved in cell wall biosynthesis